MMGAEPKSTEKASVINSFVRSSITGLVGLLGGAVEAVRNARWRWKVVQRLTLDSGFEVKLTFRGIQFFGSSLYTSQISGISCLQIDLFLIVECI